MPYIESKKDRERLDEIVESIARGVRFNGELNYVLFALCKRYITPSYSNYKNYLGELSECIAEIRRSLLGPYEDMKKIQNGDV